MKLFQIFALSAAAITACDLGPPVYRANAKLFVSRAVAAIPAGESLREDNDRFVNTQIVIMQSATVLRRVQQRLRKTPEEVRELLANLKIARVGNADIIAVSVESRSADFAKEFANAVMDEYLRFRDEQRASAEESALLQLTREINRLSQELKAANDRLLAYTKQHSVAPDADIFELQLMREDRDRVKNLYNTLLNQLLKIDATNTFHLWNVSVLEYAIVELH